MHYKEPVKIEKSQANLFFFSENPEDVANACLSTVLFEDDWEWGLKRLSGIAFNPREVSSLRLLAVTCMGHLVRENKTVDVDVVENLLRLLSSDPVVAGVTSDALDDLVIFRRR